MDIKAFVASEVNGTWHTAEEVAGTLALNHGGAQVGRVSCPSAGNCSAGGTYTDAFLSTLVFVVNET